MNQASYDEGVHGQFILSELVLLSSLWHARDYSLPALLMVTSYLTLDHHNCLRYDYGKEIVGTTRSRDLRIDRRLASHMVGTAMKFVTATHVQGL